MAWPRTCRAHKTALAQKLRLARANAKQSDIFTPDVSKRIRGLFSAEFKGSTPEARLVRNSIGGAEQLKDMPLRVGMNYPDKLAYSTVPQTSFEDPIFDIVSNLPASVQLLRALCSS